MLIDEAEVALNDLSLACRDAANHYRDAADLMDDGKLEDLFLLLAREHEQLADEVAAIIRETGGLPRDMDVEREEVSLLWSRIKAALAEDKRSTLVREMINREKHIESLIDYALQQDLAAATVTDLTAMRVRIGEALARLEQEL